MEFPSIMHSLNRFSLQKVQSRKLKMLYILQIMVHNSFVNQYIYESIAIISIILSLVYAFRWNHRYSIFFTLMYIIIPVTCTGYAVINKADVLQMALLGNDITYLGGCFLILIITFNIYDLCKIRIKSWQKNLMFFINAIAYLSVLTSGQLDIFYKSVTFNPTGYGPEKLIKEYGIMHTLYYCMIALYFVLCLIAIIRGFKNSSAVSRKTVLLLMICTCGSIVMYACKSLFTFTEVLLPLSYVFAQFIFLFIADRLVLYDVEHSVIDVSVQRGQIATISFDKKRNFLGSNNVAKTDFSELHGLRIDSPVPFKKGILENIDRWIDDVIASDDIVVHLYETTDRIYRVSGDEITDGKRVRGYNFMINDDTKEQKYLRLIKDYNKTLEDDVKKKTEEISHINDIFGRNVSPQIRDYLLKGNVSLGGENRDVTIMFCDIRNFTGLSENMSSEKVVELINEFFTGLEKCISAHNGVINKYIGDAVMAIFGAPMPVKNHELDAFLAAKEMREELKVMNKRFVEQGFPELHFGIGLHSGSVLAGTIGAASRMEYTVIGDAVNTASRIEGLCKVYKKDLLISEACCKAIEESDKNIKLNFVADTEIRGREQKVKLFTD